MKCIGKHCDSCVAHIGHNELWRLCASNHEKTEQRKTYAEEVEVSGVRQDVYRTPGFERTHAIHPRLQKGDPRSL